MSIKILSKILPTSENSIAYTHMLIFPEGKDKGIRKWIPNCIDVRINAIALTLLSTLDILLTATRLCLYAVFIVPVFMTDKPIFKDFFCSTATFVKSALAVIHGKNEGLLPYSDYERLTRAIIKDKKYLSKLPVPISKDEKETLTFLVKEIGINNSLEIFIRDNKFELLDIAVKASNAKSMLLEIILKSNDVIPDSYRNALFKQFSCEPGDFVVTVLTNPNVPEKIKNNLTGLCCIQTGHSNGVEAQNQVVREFEDSVKQYANQLTTVIELLAKREVIGEAARLALPDYASSLELELAYQRMCTLGAYFPKDQLKQIQQLQSVPFILKNIAKAQDLLIQTQTHEYPLLLSILTVLAEAAQQLDHPNLQPHFKTQLIPLIAKISHEMIPLINNEIIRTKIDITRSLFKQEANQPETEKEIAEQPANSTALINQINQQQRILRILKNMKGAQELTQLAENHFSEQGDLDYQTKIETITRKARIQLTGAKKDLRAPHAQQLEIDFSPLLTELDDKIKKMRSALITSSPSCAASIIQKRWRSRRRQQLTKANQTYEEWRIQNANKKQLDDLNAEDQRLTKAGISLQGSSISNYSLPRAVVAKRALQRKKMYSETHDVFTHGQSFYVSILNDLTQELTHTFTPSKYHPHAPWFRVPELVPQSDTVSDFFKNHPNFSSDNAINNELLSVDAYFYNTDSSESAQDFFSSNQNISTNVKPRAFAILHHFLDNGAICNILAQKMETIATRKNNETNAGTLHTICIPKVVVNNPKKNYAYRSHSFGRKCNCAFHMGDEAVLNALQKDTLHRCNHTAIPQFRLVTSALSRDTSVRSFAFSALSKAKEEEYRKEIQNVVLELHVYARLLKLSTPPSELELTTLQQDIRTLTSIPNFDQSILTPLLAQKQAFIQIA